MQLLLKQSPAGIDIIQKTFNLTDGEKYLLLESGVGEGIFFAGQKHVAIKVQASYTEDQIITTNPQQLLEIEASKRAFEAELSAQEEAAAQINSIPSAEEEQNIVEQGGKEEADRILDSLAE